MTLLHIPLPHLLHQHISLNLHLLPQRSIHDPPLSTDRQRSHRRLSIHQSIDAIRYIGERELECGLANGLLVRHFVDAWFSKVGRAGKVFVRDQGWAGCADVLLMVMEGGNGLLGGTALWNWG